MNMNARKINMSKQNTTVMQVSPAIAREWMAHNTDNRKLRPSHIRYLAEAMQRGEWVLTHQGIAFAPDGRLLDGQHRLLAVIESGRTVPMLVTMGLPDTAFWSIDLHGVRRTHGDVLKATTAETGLAGLAYRLHTKRFGGTAISVAQLAPYVRVFSMLFDKLNNGDDGGTKLLRNSHIRLAAILAAENGEGYDYVRPLHHNLVHREYQSLPAVALAFIKRVDTRELRTGSTDMSMIVHARRVFTRGRAAQAKTAVRDLPGRVNELGLEVGKVLDTYRGKA